jgi:hypothetical protein
MANPFVHVELQTEDLAAARKFYQKLFAWKLADLKMPDGSTYVSIDVGQKGRGGGMMKKPMPEAPTMWFPYVQVDSVKRTIAKARKLGAQVPLEYMEVMGMGAMGVLVDPTGGALGVWEAWPMQRAPKKKPAAKPKKK